MNNGTAKSEQVSFPGWDPLEYGTLLGNRFSETLLELSDLSVRFFQNRVRSRGEFTCRDGTRPWWGRGVLVNSCNTSVNSVDSIKFCLPAGTNQYP
jgi:hypothetical protein